MLLWILAAARIMRLSKLWGRQLPRLLKQSIFCSAIRMKNLVLQFCV